MTATVGVPRETFPGERRVALTPKACEALAKAKLAIADSWYREGGAHGLAQAEAESDGTVQGFVQALQAHPEGPEGEAYRCVSVCKG